MRADKIAEVMSALSAPFVGARPKATPSVAMKTPTTAPGVGERMRRETSSALEQALAHGKQAALACFKIKEAAIPLAHPMSATQGLALPHPNAPTMTPHPAPAAAGPRPGYGLTAAEEAQAQQLRGMSHTQRQDALGLNDHVPPPAATAPPAAAAAGPSRMQQFMQPVKRGLGYAALGTAGALALGMHHQNQQDRDARDLVYAPMQGAY